MKILSFKINKSKYCLDVDNIQEIVTLSGKISKIPGSNEYIEGMCLVRDKAIVVFNLAKYLGLNDSFEKNTMIILMPKNKDDRPIGLLINEVEKIIDTEILSSQKIDFGNNYVEDVYVDEREGKNEIFVNIKLSNILKAIE